MIIHVNYNNYTQFTSTLFPVLFVYANPNYQPILKIPNHT